jgi:hypothetical protein
MSGRHRGRGLVVASRTLRPWSSPISILSVGGEDGRKERDERERLRSEVRTEDVLPSQLVHVAPAPPVVHLICDRPASN